MSAKESKASPSDDHSNRQTHPPTTHDSDLACCHCCETCDPEPSKKDGGRVFHTAILGPRPLMALAQMIARVAKQSLSLGVGLRGGSVVC